MYFLLTIQLSSPLSSSAISFRVFLSSANLLAWALHFFQALSEDRTHTVIADTLKENDFSNFSAIFNALIVFNTIKWLVEINGTWCCNDKHLNEAHPKNRHLQYLSHFHRPTPPQELSISLKIRKWFPHEHFQYFLLCYTSLPSIVLFEPRYQLSVYYCSDVQSHNVDLE